MANEPPWRSYGANLSANETTIFIDGKSVQQYSKSIEKPARRERPPRKTNAAVFVGPKLKIERAKHHISDLKAASKAFGDANPYALVREIDRQTGENVYRVRVKKPVPIEFSGIIGDAVHNLRSALDGIVCDLIRIRSKGDAGHGGFPIHKGTKRLKPGSMAKIKGVSPKAERLILWLKTRKGWNNPAWILHRLDVIDKHNRIVAVGAASVQVTARAGIPGLFVGPAGELGIGGGGPGWRPLLGQPGTPSQFRVVCPVEDNVEIYRSPGGFNEQLQGALTIAFNETEIAKGQPVIETLEQLTELVERTLWVFERYAYRD